MGESLREGERSNSRSRLLSFALDDSRVPSATLLHARQLLCALSLLATFVLFRLLSCSLGDSSAPSATLVRSQPHVRSRQLSCALSHSYAIGDSRAISATLVRSRRLLCAFGNSRALSATLARSLRLSCAVKEFESALV